MKLMRFSRWFVAVAALCLLAGCSMPKLSWLGIKPSLSWDELIVNAADNANQNTPVAFDVVFVYDDATMDKVASLTAARWMASRSDLMKSFPSTLRYKSWELVPGQILRVPAAALDTPRLTAVFLFADYLAPGEHRIKADLSQKIVMVQLASREFFISNLKN